MKAVPDSPTRVQMFRVFLIVAFWGSFHTPNVLALPQAEVTLGAGERIWLRLDKDLSTKTAHEGDPVKAELESPRVAKGSRVIGTVLAARAADKAQRIPARLKVTFNQIVLGDGHKIPMEGSVEINGWGMGNIGGKAGAFAAVVAMGALGALIGDIANGASGAGTGGAIGASVGGVTAGLMPRANWKDVRIQKGRPFAVELKQDVRLPIAPAAKP